MVSTALARFVLAQLAVLLALRANLAFSETVWWRTEGAEVLGEEAKPEAPASCSLVFFTPDQAAVFRWRKNETPAITFNDSRWHFNNQGERLLVAVRIGARWLSRSDPAEQQSPAIEAIGLGSFIKLEIDEPLESLLRQAAWITVDPLGSRGSEMTLELNRRKLPKLLAALERCRGLLRSGG